MAGASPYDVFAEIYDAWSGAAPVTARNLGFYVELCARADGPVVELGAGNGRIALEVAARGVEIHAVDSSPAMLAVLRERAKRRGLADRVHVQQADMRAFELPGGSGTAALITIPFHTIGHMCTPEDRRRVLAHAFEQLAPGGRLVFDHFVFDPAVAEKMNVPGVRAEFVDERSGRQVVLWSASSYDMETQVIHVLTWTDSFEKDGEVAERSYRRLDLGWVDPEELRDHLESCGFEVEHLWGDFDHTPFDASSSMQVWTSRKP